MLTTNPEYWEQRYQEDTAKWDIGMAAPPFASLLASTKAPIAGKTAVIGCGQGHDAILFAKHGFDTIGFDFAPSAIALGQKLSQTMGISMQFLQRDIFALPQEFAASFDYAIEHTCFCAIRPEQRSDYVKMVRSILKPTFRIIHAVRHCSLAPHTPRWKQVAALFVKINTTAFSSWITFVRNLKHYIPSFAGRAREWLPHAPL